MTMTCVFFVVFGICKKKIKIDLKKVTQKNTTLKITLISK